MRMFERRQDGAKMVTCKWSTETKKVSKIGALMM
jgi:hypothetical protein